MRNYFAIWSQWFDVWDRTDPMNPVITAGHRQFSGSEEDAVAYEIAVTQDNGTQTIYYTVQEAIKISSNDSGRIESVEA